MAVDKELHPVKVGDTVLVECTVVRILDTNDNCNITVHTTEPCPPLGHLSEFHLNSKQVELKTSKPAS